ncbi:MAG: Bug family tripartite tricarboxylate transporter substrate binding protein [Burkholderiales bacterium]
MKAVWIAFGISGVLAAAPVWPQQYPVKSVRIIAPFAPGGTADTLGRIAATKLPESLGQSFIVETRAGAGGMLGSELASKSAPDGYTLVVSGVASHVIGPALAAKPAFDPVRDFTHIALFGGPPAVFGVHPSLPVKDLKALVALARSRPHELSYGSPGVGTQGHLMAEIFRQRAKIDIVHVPYKGAAIAMVDIVAGNIHAISTTLTTASTQIRAGRARALALSSEKRLADYSAIPTFRELGYRNVVGTVWFSLSGPPGMPADLVTRLNTEVRRILQLADVRARLRPDGIEPNQLDAKAFTDYMAAEIKRWAPVVRASGARAD